MIRTPAVSVIIPTFNRARLVERAMRSVLAQTIEDFEIIVIDDASTDNTRWVVDRIDDSRIRYLHHESNRGGAAARNSGIEVATGTYIAFLDSDDRWLPHKLERQIPLLSSQPNVGLAYSGYEVVDDVGRVIERVTPRFRGQLYSLLLRRNCMGASTVVVRAACLNRIGGFDERLPSCQDWDLWIRCARHYRVDYIPEPLMQYTRSTQSIRISRDVESSIRGHNMIIDKHLDPSATNYDHILAEHHFRLGKRLFLEGHHHMATSYFQSAFRGRPTHPLYACYLLASYLGPASLQVLERVRQWLTPLLHKFTTISFIKQ